MIIIAKLADLDNSSVSELPLSLCTLSTFSSNTSCIVVTNNVKIDNIPVVPLRSALSTETHPPPLTLSGQNTPQVCYNDNT